MDERMNWIRRIRCWLEKQRIQRIRRRQQRQWERHIQPLFNRYAHAITLRYGQPKFYYGWRHARRLEQTLVEQTLAKHGINPPYESLALELERAVLDSIRRFHHFESW